jgi:hypothetical protein
MGVFELLDEHYKMQQGGTWEKQKAKVQKEKYQGNNLLEMLQEDKDLIERLSKKDRIKKETNIKTSDNTKVKIKTPNKKEAESIIVDENERDITGILQKPKAEANKFEKYLPDENTINFFKSLKENLGDEYFTRALLQQHRNGNPSVNVGTNKGLIFSNRRNYNPFKNDINIPKGLLPEDDLSNYLLELSHANQEYPRTAFKFLGNDVPNYIKSYILEGDTEKNIIKYVYENPTTVEYESHKIIEPKLKEAVYDIKQQGGKFTENEKKFLEELAKLKLI